MLFQTTSTTSLHHLQAPKIYNSHKGARPSIVAGLLLATEEWYVSTGGRCHQCRSASLHYATTVSPIADVDFVPSTKSVEDERAGCGHGHRLKTTTVQRILMPHNIFLDVPLEIVKNVARPSFTASLVFPTLTKSQRSIIWPRGADRLNNLTKISSSAITTLSTHIAQVVIAIFNCKIKMKQKLKKRKASATYSTISNFTRGLKPKLPPPGWY